MDGHIAHALAGRVAPEEIVVIYTDESGTAPLGRFPDGAREVDFASHAAHMDTEWQEHTLVMLLRSFQADSIVNINSGTFHRAMRTYGSALATTERLFPIFFCNEQKGIGNSCGWPSSQFYRLFDQVTNIITDSEHLAQWFNDIYQLDASSREKIRVLRAPADPSMPVVSPDASSRPSLRATVSWAGRWDRQKEIDLIVQIARLMPEVDFRMWGESTPHASRSRASARQHDCRRHVRGIHRSESRRSRRMAPHVRLGQRANDPARGGDDRRSHCRQPRQRNP